MGDLRRILANLAEETLLRAQSTQSESMGLVRTKGAGDIATTGDMQAEAHLMAKLGELFPGVSVLTEETGFKGEPGDQVFVVDPIDGSTNFHRGNEHYAVSIALLEKGMPQFSAAAVGARREIYSAEKGKGAFLNENPITVSSEPLGQLSMVALQSNFKHSVPPYLKWIYQNGGKIRNYGSAVSHICQIASRRMDLCIVRQLKLWDFAAAGHVLLEAGGFLSDFRLNPLFPCEEIGPETGGRSYTVIASNKEAYKSLPREASFFGLS